MGWFKTNNWLMESWEVRGHGAQRSVVGTVEGAIEMTGARTIDTM